MILLVLVAVDASALVCYITRFTEENFATLIAFIFIYKAVENVIAIGSKYPINPNNGSCLCRTSQDDTLSNTARTNWTLLNKEACEVKTFMKNNFYS